MFLHEAEGRGRDAPGDAKRGGETLRERRLARTKIAFKADDIARLQLGREPPCKLPRLLDGIDLKDTRHLSAP